MRYTIEQFTTPTTYDDPWQPDPNWMESPFFYGKSWKTEQGATRALNKLVKMGNYDPSNFRLKVSQE